METTKCLGTPLGKVSEDWEEKVMQGVHDAYAKKLEGAELLTSCDFCIYKTLQEFNKITLTVCKFPAPFFSLTDTIVMSPKNHPECKVKKAW